MAWPEATPFKIELFDPALGEDFGWQREPDAVVQREAKPLEKRPVAARKATPAKQRARAKELLRRREFETLIKGNLIDKIFITPMLWEGTVTLPQVPGEDRRYRPAIAEYEEYLVDDPRPYDPVLTKKDRRLVFIEYVELG